MISLFRYLATGCLWYLDNALCDQLTKLRVQSLPGILAPTTQLHALFHIMAGYTSYLCVQIYIANEQR